MPKADYSQLSSERIIAQPGRYHVRITKAGPPKNQDANGAQVAQVTYDILGGDDKAAIGGKITDFVQFTGTQAWKFRNLTKSLNDTRTADEPEFIEGEEWLYEWLIGRELEIDLEYGQKKNPEGTAYIVDPEKRRVKNYMPYMRSSELPDDFMNFASKIG
jgi:hypothetical protein